MSSAAPATGARGLSLQLAADVALFQAFGIPLCLSGCQAGMAATGFASLQCSRANVAAARFGRVNVVRLAASKGCATSRKAQLKTMAAVQFDYNTKCVPDAADGWDSLACRRLAGVHAAGGRARGRALS